MRNNTDIRHGRHCVFKLHVHLVLVTKYRRGVFTKAVLNELREIFSAVCTDFEAERVEFDGEDDYVHQLVNYPPKVAVSALVNSLNGVSSSMIRKKITLKSKRNYGVVRYGRQVTLRVVVAVRLYRLFVSTLNNKERLNHYFRDLSRLHPRHERRGFTLHMDKTLIRFYRTACRQLKRQVL
jgi:REP element-mobilizing transposase RayT